MALTPIEIDIEKVNQQLEGSSPQEILKWSIENLPDLYQTTAFGLTGLAALDMISKISKAEGDGQHPVPLIFIDTLYHFPETVALTKVVEGKYEVGLNVYTPWSCSTTAQFEEMYGKELWKTDEDVYDYTVKVEPARRAYEELNVRAVITGRRRSQGNERSSIPPIEKDETGLIKVNPLYNWNFQQVKEYIDRNKVPYNPLLDKGYRSVGDTHSTKPVNATTGIADERSGRWAGSAKKECGLHKDYFLMKKKFEKKAKETARLLKDAARDEEPVEESVITGLSLLSLKPTEVSS